MKPNKFNRMMDSEIKSALLKRQFSPPAQLSREMVRVWKKWAKKDDDYRSGTETYGYATPDSVALDMLYISDRWRCAFRLKWLIDMPTEEAK